MATALAIPFLSRDHVVVTRDVHGEDPDGMESPTSKIVYDGRGSWRNTSTKEIPYAQALGQRIDGAVALPSDCGVLVGDDLTVRGAEWEVIGTVDVRLFVRALVRRVDVPGA